VEKEEALGFFPIDLGKFLAGALQPTSDFLDIISER
jgi:hypothetical protein